MANNPSHETHSLQHQADSNGGLSLKRLILVGVAIGVAAMAVKQLPDLRRYLKMKSM
ncbi:MAG TPA: hypothetical protein VGH98_22390 [Gemmatimonadaceae bacterium]|jgi:hypothetical protein